MSQVESNGPVKIPERPTRLTEEELERLRDMRWAETDPEAQEKYADEWVAVYRRQIIAHGEDLKTVLDEAQRITGLPRHQIAVTTILGPKMLFAGH